MRGVSWWHISIGAMAFGSAGVAVAGFMMVVALTVLTVCALLFYAIRWAARGLFPKKIVQQECSQELLDYWAPYTADMMARQARERALRPPG